MSSSKALDNEDKSDAGRLKEARKQSVTKLMGTYEGRWFLADLMESSNLLQGRYLHDKDALGMAWRDGRASIAVTILELIEEHDPDNYARLIRERRNRMANAQTRAEKRATETKEPASPFATSEAPPTPFTP